MWYVLLPGACHVCPERDLREQELGKLWVLPSTVLGSAGIQIVYTCMYLGKSTVMSTGLEQGSSGGPRLCIHYWGSPLRCPLLYRAGMVWPTFGQTVSVYTTARSSDWGTFAKYLTSTKRTGVLATETIIRQIRMVRTIRASCESTGSAPSVACHVTRAFGTT